MLQQKMEIVKDPRIREIHIPYEAATKLRNAFASLRLDDDKSFIKTKTWFGSTVRYCLPEHQINIIQDFKESDESCALIIRGLPIDSDLGATPYNGYIAPSKTPLASGCHIGIYQLAGIEPISFQTENQGLLFRHVVPNPKARTEKSSHGSTHTFGHHVDNPDLPLACERLTDKSGCPEFLSLMAMRSDLSVRSNFVLVDDLLTGLSAGVIDELLKPNFKISRPDSFGQAISTVLPILVMDDYGTAYCRFDKENVTPLTESAAAALLMFEARLNDESLKHYLVYQPGDLLLIKNQRILHSREGFQPRDDGADRWLIRLFGMSSLDRIVTVYDDRKYIGKD
ncbi:TauD/TfdA family dioxygenase [Grimontia kaedaensis]|uniref:TauD/TfdA family dioxygenase n=1 Tax=Grimontia kaedaensis TaxID=2872157 RepID=A0ABY4WXW7_9GAMM|nr:TauD/TfdA family dioxygenase [Grimontia kaedaensis]USH03826.1 TauD/TfdA family dioxygenase [Grimontia kaedaensis]